MTLNPGNTNLPNVSDMMIGKSSVWDDVIGKGHIRCVYRITNTKAIRQNSGCTAVEVTNNDR